MTDGRRPSRLHVRTYAGARSSQQQQQQKLVAPSTPQQHQGAATGPFSGSGFVSRFRPTPLLWLAVGRGRHMIRSNQHRQTWMQHAPWTALARAHGGMTLVRGEGGVRGIFSALARLVLCAPCILYEVPGILRVLPGTVT